MNKERMKTLDNLLTDILREADEEERQELKKLLRRWKMRVLFVEALQEAADEEKESNKK